MILISLYKTCIIKIYKILTPLIKKVSAVQKKMLEKYPYALVIIVPLLLTAIFTQMWGLKKSILTFVLSCYLLTGLITICKNKLYGGGYIVCISVFCNIPSLFIQKLHQNNGGLPKYYEFLQQWNYIFGLIFFAFACTLVINFISKFLSNHIIVKYSLRILASFILLLPGFYSVCYLINWAMGNPLLEFNAVLAFYQTNFSEGYSYLKDMIHIKRAMAVSFILIFTYLIAYKTVSSSFIRLNRYSCCLFIVCFFVSYNGHNKFWYNILTAPFEDADAVLQSYSDYSKLTEQRSYNTQNFKNYSKSAFDGTYVIVIGESESRVNMNCYGYKEKNTPFQTKLKMNKNSIFFNNAFSNHTHTVQVLSYALTSKNQYENQSIHTKDVVSLIEVAKNSLGYHTVWISNQSKIGFYENPISVIAESADEKYWASNFGSLSYSDKKYDENLIPYFDNLNLSKNKNLIFVHLMGSHASYTDRYPASYEIFNSDSNTVNSYNNSIFYNDHVLELILQRAKKLPNFNGMLYLSDHGDDAAKGLYHNSAQFTYPMVEIPLWLYFSDSYISEHFQIVNTLKEHIDTPYTNDLLFETVLGIIGGANSEFYNKSNDLSSAAYKHSFNDIKTLHGAKKLKMILF